jgi:dolichyl-phosphate beta-glucosyltransferase
VVLWWRAWTGGPGSTVRCSCLDPGQQVWFIAWPAYALQHGMNPLSTTWLWPPHGVNLLANASATAVGLLLAPVTWAFGPFAATTVALTLAPGLSAWACWLACRRFVAWPPACWVAGFVFGYSPFIVQSVAQGHLSGGLLIVPPLIVVVLHEILVRRQRSALWCGVILGVLLSLQFFISQEVLLMTVLTAAVGVVATAVVAPRRIASTLGFAVRSFAVAAVVTFVLLGAPVWYMLTGPGHITGAVWSGTQIFAVSMLYQLWSPGLYRSALSSFPAGTVLGPPLGFLGAGVLAAAALSLVVAWRRRVAWVAAAAALVMTACSWGGAIFLTPHHLINAGWLPWPLVWYRPFFDNILPVHFAVLVDLAAAILIAVGLDRARSWPVWSKVPAVVGPVVLAVVVAAMVLPAWSTYGAPLPVQKVALPPWYSTTARTVPAGSVIVSYPFPASAAVTSQPLVWQAADDMRFRLAGGYVKVPGPHTGVIGLGPPGSATRTLDDLTLSGGIQTVTADQLRNLGSALADWDASYIVVTDTGPFPVEAAALFTAVTARVPRVSHRAWVWELTRRPARIPVDAVRAASALRSCQLSVSSAPVVPPGRSLPQTVNACVAARIPA